LIASKELSIRGVFLLLAVTVLYYLIKNKNHFRFYMPGIIPYFFMVLSGGIVGGVHLIRNEYSSVNYLQHILYISLPFLFWLVGEKIAETKDITHTQIIRTMMITTVLYSFYDLASSMVLIARNGISSMSMTGYRRMVGTSNFLAVIGIYILTFYSREIALKRRALAILYLICFASVVIHFSRTTTIELALLILFSGMHVNFKKILNFVMAAAGMVGVMAVVSRHLFSLFMEKVLDAATELSSGQSYWTYSQIVNNWRGYEVFCEKIRFADAGLFEKIFGGGFGVGLDVFGYAYLVSNADTLSHLHNGYYTQLMIWGISGLIAMIMMFALLLAKSRKIKIRQDRFFYQGIIVTMAVITAFVKGPFFSGGVAVLFFYMSLLYFSSDKTEGVKKRWL